MDRAYIEIEIVFEAFLFKFKKNSNSVMETEPARVNLTSNFFLVQFWRGGSSSSAPKATLKVAISPKSVAEKAFLPSNTSKKLKLFVS
jgi:hypothetical protein